MDNKVLKVRPFNADDGSVFYNWYHSEELKPYFRGFVGGLSAQQCAQAPLFIRAHILVAECEELVGAATFADTDSILRVYKFGLFVDPKYQNKKLGTQITVKALQWAFNTMKAERVFAEILNYDTILKNAALKIGFQLEGIKRSACFFAGKIHDEAVYAMTREDFKLLNL